jgi:hypothetical protein
MNGERVHAAGEFIAQQLVDSTVAGQQAQVGEIVYFPEDWDKRGTWGKSYLATDSKKWLILTIPHAKPLLSSRTGR